eukprot:scaffold3412_cov124-Isochrysis_galbana.AAC.7
MVRDLDLLFDLGDAARAVKHDVRVERSGLRVVKVIDGVGRCADVAVATDHVLLVKRVAVDQHHRPGAQRPADAAQPKQDRLGGAARRSRQLHQRDARVRRANRLPVLSADEARVIHDDQRVVRAELERVNDPQNHRLTQHIHKRLGVRVALLRPVAKPGSGGCA